MPDVALAPEVYWRLRYLQADAERQRIQTRLAERIFLDQLAAAGGNPDVAYVWRDRDTTLVAPGTDA